MEEHSFAQADELNKKHVRWESNSESLLSSLLLFTTSWNQCLTQHRLQSVYFPDNGLQAVEALIRQLYPPEFRARIQSANSCKRLSTTSALFQVIGEFHQYYIGLMDHRATQPKDSRFRGT